MTEEIPMKPRSIGASKTAVAEVEHPNFIDKMFGAGIAEVSEPGFFQTYELRAKILHGKVKFYRTKRDYRRLVRATARRNNKRVGPGAVWSHENEGPGRGAVWGSE